LLGLVASGRDPLAEREAEADAQPEITFAVAVDRYIAHKRAVWKPGSFAQINHHLNNQAKPLHKLALAEVSRLRIANLLDEIEKEDGPIACNRTRTSLFAIFEWLTKRGLFEGANPVAGTDRAAEGRGRERVLSGPELAPLWAALGDDRFSNIVRLLLLTGQRRNEIGKLRWSEVDFDRAMLVLPPERVKNGRTHEVPLSPQALAILRRLPQSPKRNDDLVFSRFSGWSVAKAELDKALPKAMPHWTLHDLRRTCATGMAELGVLPHIIEACLNHISGHKAGVAGTYNRARYLPEMRTALELWANHVDAVVIPSNFKAA
jgi:integrase